MKIVTVVPFTQRQCAALKAETDYFGDEIVFLNGQEPTEDQIREADAIIGNVAPERLKGAERLKWMQLNTAGADRYVKAGTFPEGAVLTCSTGSYGTAISEYMVAMLLVMMKKIPQYLENQKAGIWKDEGSVQSPAGKRILIVGTGDIGLSFARRIRAFSLREHPIRLVGVRRRPDTCPEELDEIHGIGELGDEAAKADVIAVSLPGTKETYHLFDEEMLKKCKKGSYFMNVGRGSAVDNEALKKPEVYGNFAGIWLEVTEKEPLPENDPLYHVPGLLITPHITGDFHLDITLENIAGIAIKNYVAWKNGGRMKSVVDFSSGYAK